MTSKSAGILHIVLGTLGIVCTLVLTLMGPLHEALIRAIQSI